MKKRFLSILTAAALLLSVMALGLSPAAAAGDLTAEEYASMTAEDLVARAEIADPEHLTVDEFRWLVETYRFVDINYETLEPSDWQSITRQALDQVGSGAWPAKEDWFPVLLSSPYPQARAFAYNRISDLFGAEGSVLDAALKALETEEDPCCLRYATDGLSNEMRTRPEIADFIFRMSRSDNPVLRKQAVYGLGTSWSIGVDGVVERLIEMLKDEDPAVRKAACGRAGDLQDESVIGPLTEILNDPEQCKIHSEAIRSLSFMWLNYPFHKETSEAAYRATMDYYSRKPRTSDVPSWSGIGGFSTVSERNIGDWYALAPYFSADEFFGVMADYIADPDANWLGKKPAMDAIAALCPEKFGDLEAVMAGVEDKNVLSSYEKLKEKMAAR